MRKNLPALITGLSLLLLWQLAAMLVNMTNIVPSPTSIVARIWEYRAPLFQVHLWSTVKVIGLGMLLSIAIGLTLAILMDMSAGVEAMLYPTLVVLQTIPIMCIAPLFVLWFGYTMGARLTAVVLSTFFSITINVFDGFKNVQREMAELITTYGASRWQAFFMLKAPTALPNFMTALKITIPWAVIGAAISEWLGATNGLGYFSKRMVTKMDASSVFAPVVLLTLIALIGMGLVKRIDKRFVTWRNEL